MQSVDVKDIEVGDVFVVAGNPYGHAMTVIDVAARKSDGQRIFMLAQGYMPAQDAHIVVNPAADGSPWYSADFGEDLRTS